MPSLSRQLARLKNASTIAQGVERDYSSLLFDKAEAASLDRDQALKIGVSGLVKLKKLIPGLDEVAPQLFEASSINFNRTTIDKNENTKLHEVLEHFITVIAPYFHHQACKQVLEWLIYRYQIHTYEAELLVIALLPFHDTNSYGRLCSILHLPKQDFVWLKEVTEKGAPISFGQLLRQCIIAGGNLHLIGAVATFATQLSKNFGEEYVIENYQFYYLFFVKLCSAFLEDSANATEQALSRIIPHIGVALKSRCLPFKMAGMIIVTQLSMIVTFATETIQPILSLLLHKVKPRAFTTVLDTLIVICQRQNLKNLPVNRMYSILKRSKELGLLAYLSEVQKVTDLTGFLVPLWRVLFDLMNREVTDDELATIHDVFELTTSSNLMSAQQAHDLLSLVLELIASKELLRLPKVLAVNLKSVILRFADTFDVIRAKYVQEEDDITVESLIEQCKIKSYELGEIVTDERGKRHHKRDSLTPSNSVVDEKSNPNETRPERCEIIDATMEALAPKPYMGTPLTIVFKLASKNWNEALFMLKSFGRPEYVKRYDMSDFETFIAKTVVIATSQNIEIISEVKAAISHVPLSAEFAYQLASKANSEPLPKKRKAVGLTVGPEALFRSESDAQYEKRLTLVLEILKTHDKVQVDARLFALLFNLIETIVEANVKTQLSDYNLHLITSVFLKHVKNPSSVSLIVKSLRLDPIVKVIRFTQDHTVLRNALHILALLAPVMPTRVVTHIMEVFAFMGEGGLIKRDNDLTLSVIEEALHALFSAIMSSSSDKSDNAKLNVRRRLLAVSQVFAVSLLDVPAHRRMRILCAVANTVAPEDVWIIVGAIFDDFCGKWSKATSKKTDVDQLHDLALEFIAEFEPEHQLETAINLIDYVIEVGPDVPATHISRLGMTTKSNARIGIVVFDRTHRSIQKLRHYRFLVFGWVLKFLNYKPLYEQLGALTDDEIFDRMLGVGKRLLITVTNLSEFVDADLAMAERTVKECERMPSSDDCAELNSASQALRYWVALASKADAICDRMRCLLPTNVSGHIICDLLADADDADTGVDVRIRDRALQLLNVKLINQGGFDANGNDIHAEYLVKFAEKLTDWIRPAESYDGIALCQNAAFSLKLVAKRIPPAHGQKVFTRTLERCVALLRNWASLDEAMIGNVLLLLGELVRSQDFKATMLNSDGICKILLSILCETEVRATQIIKQTEAERQKALMAANDSGITTCPNNIDVVNMRRQRNTHMSLCGRQYGDDALLLCSLTCAQRLFDHAASYITAFYEAFLHVISQLSAKYVTPCVIEEKRPNDVDVKGVLASPRLDNIRIRLAFIRTTMSKQELRLLIDPFKNVCIKFSKRPLSLATVANLISDSLRASKPDHVTKVIGDLAELFTLLFKFRRNEVKVEKFGMYNYAEDAVIGAFLTLIDHMKATSLRPMINGFTDHIRAAANANNSSHESRRMALTMFNFANQFLDAYHSLALPYFVQLFDLGVKILRSLNASKMLASELFIDGTQSGSVQQAQANRLITLILIFVTKVARFTTFFSEDLAVSCYEVVVDELENYKVEGHESRCVPHLASAIYAISEAYVDVFNREICNRVLLHTRHESSKVRYRTTLVFENLVDRVGDSLAPLLPMIVQYLSELLEDTNPKVSMQCEKTIRLLRSKFGDEILGKD